MEMMILICVVITLNGQRIATPIAIEESVPQAGTDISRIGKYVLEIVRRLLFRTCAFDESMEGELSIDVFFSDKMVCIFKKRTLLPKDDAQINHFIKENELRVFIEKGLRGCPPCSWLPTIVEPDEEEI